MDLFFFDISISNGSMMQSSMEMVYMCLASPCQMGMIRCMSLESCCPGWDFATRLCSDLQSKLDEDVLFLLEQSMVRLQWLHTDN